MDQINELLTRGVEKIYPSKEFLEKVLRQGKKLKLYLGVDPSGEELHIGHMVVLKKLEQFRKLGHQVILLIGDFTGIIGDPTDKSATRKKMTHKQVLTNARDYKKQASKILRFDDKNPIQIKYNSKWLSKLTFSDIVELSSYFTVQQMIERDMFQTRLTEQKPIYLHEFLYPLMQGYDSVAMKVDLEIGGTDQTFNMLAGRKLVKEILAKEKFVLTLPLLVDSSGKKIGKTEGNVIALTARSQDLYGMIMHLPDGVIVKCFELITDMPLEEIKKIDKKIKHGENPMNYKKKLAYTLTKMLNNQHQAEKAQRYFETTFQRGKIVADLPLIKLKIKGLIPLIDLLVTTNLISSKAQAKRLIQQGAIEIDREKTTDHKMRVNIKDGIILRVGKYRIVKIIR